MMLTAMANRALLRVKEIFRKLLAQLGALIAAPQPKPLPVRTGRGSAARKRST